MRNGAWDMMISAAWYIRVQWIVIGVQSAIILWSIA